MRFVWVKPQPSDKNPPNEHEGLGAGAEKGKTGTEFKEQQRDLKPYFDLLKKRNLNQKERADFRKKLEQWDAEGNVEAMRRGGIEEQENLKDPLKRHVILSSEFLEPIEAAGQHMFRVNFKANQTAYWEVGAADLLAPNITTINVKKEDGMVVSERAVRRVNPGTGRIGYFDEKLLEQGIYEYVPVFSGDVITVLETGAMPAEGSPASMKEHVEIYQKGAMKDSASEPVEMRYNAKTRTLYPDAKTGIEARRAAVPGETQRELADLQAEIATSPVEGELRQKIVGIAKQYSGKKSFDEPFRNISALKGGQLGCAYVATTILKDAGVLDKVVYGTYTAEHELRQKGWTVAPRSQAEPGDVVIWEKLGQQRLVMTANGPEYVGGHRHIGIVVGKNAAVSNSSRLRGPTTHPIDGPRGVEMVLKPPRAMAARAEQPQEKEPRRESFAPQRASEKINTGEIRDVLEKHPDWNKYLDEAMDTYGVPKEYKYIFCFIMKIESGFNPNARPISNGRKLSSAYGLAQTLDGAWNGIQNQMKKDGTMPRNLTFRNGEQPPEWQIKSLVANVVKNILPSARLRLSHDPKEIAKIYLCYHDGVGGYLNALKPWLDANGGEFVDMPDDETNARYMKYGFQKQRGAKGTNQILHYAYDNVQRVAMNYKTQLQDSRFV